MKNFKDFFNVAIVKINSTFSNLKFSLFKKKEAQVVIISNIDTVEIDINENKFNFIVDDNNFNSFSRILLGVLSCIHCITDIQVSKLENGLYDITCFKNEKVLDVIEISPSGNMTLILAEHKKINTKKIAKCIVQSNTRNNFYVDIRFLTISKKEQEIK